MIVLYVLLGILSLYLLYIVFLFVLSLTIEKREYEKDSPFFRFILNSSTKRVLFLLGVRYTVNGMEKIPRDRKCLFVSNHPSNYDPIVSWLVFKDWKIAFISKKENFSIPIFGRIIRRCCFMAIDRKNIRNAIPTINKAGELLKRGEVSIGVYPEGTRDRGKELLPFHDCMFRIAMNASSPIVVLTVKGTENIFNNIKRLRKTKVEINVLSVFYPEETEGLRSTEIGALVRKEMEEKL